MPRLLLAATLLAVLVSCRPADGGAVYCGNEIKDPQGELIISSNTSNCVFTTAPETKELILDTDGLSLAANDKLDIESGDKSRTYTFEPPSDAGYLHIGGEYVRPSLTFIFQSVNNHEMAIKYSLSQSLPINADINHDFNILNVGTSPAMELKFLKTLNETIHIEFTPPQVISSESISGNFLMAAQDNMTTFFANAQHAELIHVKTTIVDKRCSNTFSPLTKSQEISGPQEVKKPYQCVNLFKLDKTESPEAHFDVDFANFLSLAANSDQLVIKDSSRIQFIDRSSEMDFRGRKISTIGSELIVIYKAPNVTNYNQNLGLKLKVVPEKFGGIISDKADIQLRADSPTTYTLIPDEFKCVSLAPLDLKGILGDGRLNISIGGAVVSAFGPNTFLPPIIGVSEPTKQVVVSYSGKQSFKLRFSPDGSCCHQLSSDSSGRFWSVSGGQQSSCYWTLATSKDVMINFDENDLDPKGCVTIYSMITGKKLYSRCNIKHYEVIPKFVVSQAYVEVSLSEKDTKFTASSVPALKKLSLREDGRYMSNLTTPGYPVSYPVLNGGSEIYQLNASEKNYLINIADLDLRFGEKLLIGTDEITNQDLLAPNDVLVSNKTVNITVSRPTPQTDFSLRRGFQISTLNFKTIKVLSGNVTTNNSITLSNLENSLIKISSPVLARVNYVITSNNSLSDGVEMKLFDGPSISSPSSTRANGSTTSGNLMIIARATKPNITIPALTINYWYSACNKTDDLLCDKSTRCVPREFQCKGKYYCLDGSDMRQDCKSTGPPPPQPSPGVPTGLGGFSVFILCTLMLTLGVLLSTYGPGLYRTLEDRFRGQGQYNSFTSVE